MDYLGVVDIETAWGPVLCEDCGHVNCICDDLDRDDEENQRG